MRGTPAPQRDPGDAPPWGPGWGSGTGRTRGKPGPGATHRGRRGLRGREGTRGHGEGGIRTEGEGRAGDAAPRGPQIPPPRAGVCGAGPRPPPGAARCRSGGAVPSAPALTGSAAARRCRRSAPPRPAAARPPPAPGDTRGPARSDTRGGGGMRDPPANAARSPGTRPGSPAEPPEGGGRGPPRPPRAPAAEGRGRRLLRGVNDSPPRQLAAQTRQKSAAGAPSPAAPGSRTRPPTRSTPGPSAAVRGGCGSLIKVPDKSCHPPSPFRQQLPLGGPSLGFLVLFPPRGSQGGCEVLREAMPKGVCGGIEGMMPTELRIPFSEGFPGRNWGAPPCRAPRTCPQGDGSCSPS